MIDESLRWLIANGRTTEARTIVDKACRLNRVDLISFLNKLNLNEDLLIQIQRDDRSDNRQGSTHMDGQSSAEQTKIIKVEKYSFLDILKNKQLLFTSLILWYAW